MALGTQLCATCGEPFANNAGDDCGVCALEKLVNAARARRERLAREATQRQMDYIWRTVAK